MIFFIQILVLKKYANFLIFKKFPNFVPMKNWKNKFLCCVKFFISQNFYILNQTKTWDLSLYLYLYKLVTT